MNLIKSQGNIVEKVLRDKDGKLIRARFFVYENNGRIRARLLDFVYLSEQALLNGANFILSGFATAKAIFKKIKFLTFYTSKLVPQEIIYTSGSKPRAPTF